MIQYKKKAISYFLATIILLTVNYYYNVFSFPFDSALYWALAVSPEVVDTRDIIRGYLFPSLIKAGVNFFGFFGLDQLNSFRLFSSLVYAHILAVQLPSIFIKIFGGTDSVLRRIFPVIFFALVFPGLLIYPLSDIPALAFMWGAIYFGNLDWQEESDRKLKFLYLFASGLLAAAAYNTRTIYLFPGLLLLGVLLYGHRRNVFPMAFFLAGIVTVTIPQWNLNKGTHGISSVNPAIGLAGPSLFTQQLMWGLTTQKYETNVAPQAPAGVRYLDPEGEALLKKINGVREIRHAGDYVRVVLLFPLDFTRLYFRHLVNGLDVRDGQAYISSPPTKRRIISQINFCILLGGLGVIFSAAAAGLRKKNKVTINKSLPASLNALMLLLPAIAVIPSAVETRFFLPVHCLLYLALAMRFNISEIRDLSKKDIFTLGIIAIILISIFSTVSKSTMRNIAVHWAS